MSDIFSLFVNSLEGELGAFLDRGYSLPVDLNEKVGRLKGLHADYSSLVPDHGKFFSAESRGFGPGDDSLPPWIRRYD